MKIFRLAFTRHRLLAIFIAVGTSVCVGWRSGNWGEGIICLILASAPLVLILFNHPLARFKGTVGYRAGVPHKVDKESSPMLIALIGWFFLLLGSFAFLFLKK